MDARTKKRFSGKLSLEIESYRRRLRGDRRCSRWRLTLRISSAGTACTVLMSESPSSERRPSAWFFSAADFRAKLSVEGLPSSDLPVPQRAGLIACKAVAFDLWWLHAVPPSGWHRRWLEWVLGAKKVVFV